MDIKDIKTLPQQIDTLLSSFPKLDTVMVAAGIQSSFDFKDPKSTSPDAIDSEVDINVTAPMIIAHLLVPHFISLKRPTTFILVSSGLAFVPVPLYPIYCGTKSAIHSFAVNLRAQLLETQCKVVELAPPYVDTPLDAAHRGKNIQAQAGPEKAVKPMALEEYLDSAMKGLEDGRNEVAVGFAQMGVDKWRQAFGSVLEMMGNKPYGVRCLRSAKRCSALNSSSPSKGSKVPSLHHAI